MHSQAHYRRHLNKIVFSKQASELDIYIKRYLQKETKNISNSRSRGVLINVNTMHVVRGSWLFMPSYHYWVPAGTVGVPSGSRLCGRVREFVYEGSWGLNIIFFYCFISIGIFLLLNKRQVLLDLSIKVVYSSF